MLRRGLLSDYFEGIAVKKLSQVEANPEKSNQHEFNGARQLKRLFGDDDRLRFPATFVWLGDEQEGISESAWLSWYDSRRNQPHRSSEYRLYYPPNSAVSLMQTGDTVFIATRRDGSAMVIVTPSDSTFQNQLVWLFGIDQQPELAFQVREIQPNESSRIDFAARYILDELGIEAEEPDADALDGIIEKFGVIFPGTREFSGLARSSLTDISAHDEDADKVLMAWLEREELLFRRLERHVVADRLRAGFLSDDIPDVESFLSFSLSVQNRRKSRAGQSLEHHLEALFKARGLIFQRGVETENRNKPDFLFPGQEQYRDESFDPARLTMLGAKSTCKDRWRQVLSEANRIGAKHLLTLEPGITENQTDEMQAKSLQLVLPQSLHRTYKPAQQGWLMDVNGFIDLVKQRATY